MPLAGAVAINFSAPLFAALVSIVWLKEPAGFVRGGALVIGFVGVLIVTNPGTNSLTLGALFALTNAVMYGTVTVAVRGMTRTESANALVMWQLAVLAFFHSSLLLFGWRSPSAIDAAMLFGTGFTNAIGQWFWTKALQFAPAPAVRHTDRVAAGAGRQAACACSHHAGTARHLARRAGDGGISTRLRSVRLDRFWRADENANADRRDAE
jgi:hypothetical protein